MSPTPPSTLLHSAFYRFTPLADPPAAAAMLRGLAQRLQGSIVVAAEGLNGTVAGTPDAVADFEAVLQQPQVLGGVLAGMTYKHSACKTAPFGRLKVRVKAEIVALGLPALPSALPLPPPDEHDASHLAPSAWRDLLAQDGVVLLDNRNHFEFRLGHFRGAVDPQVNNFRDFVAYVQDQAPAWRAAGRPVAMYCTGGIRCDKTAPWLRSLGLAVWQLDGGLLNYFQAEAGDASALANGAPPDSVWQGECFVFDKRIALDAQLQETATSAEQVFDGHLPDEAWRLQRAQRLAEPAA